ASSSCHPAQSTHARTRARSHVAAHAATPPPSRQRNRPNAPASAPPAPQPRPLLPSLPPETMTADADTLRPRDKGPFNDVQKQYGRGGVEGAAQPFGGAVRSRRG